MHNKKVTIFESRWLICLMQCLFLVCCSSQNHRTNSCIYSIKGNEEIIAAMKSFINCIGDLNNEVISFPVFSDFIIEYQNTVASGNLNYINARISSFIKSEESNPFFYNNPMNIQAELWELSSNDNGLSTLLRYKSDKACKHRNCINLNRDFIDAMDCYSNDENFLIDCISSSSRILWFKPHIANATKRINEHPAIVTCKSGPSIALLQKYRDGRWINGSIVKVSFSTVKEVELSHRNAVRQERIPICELIDLNLCTESEVSAMTGLLMQISEKKGLDCKDFYMLSRYFLMIAGDKCEAITIMNCDEVFMSSISLELQFKQINNIWYLVAARYRGPL